MVVCLVFVFRNSAQQVGVAGIFDRVLTELVAKMREMKMDKTELGCLRSIILFNPGNLFLLLFIFIIHSTNYHSGKMVKLLCQM